MLVYWYICQKYMYNESLLNVYFGTVSYDQCNKLKFKIIIIIINVVFHLNVSCLFSY